MKTVPVKLLTTEVLDGVKRRPGETVTLPENHPVAVKTAALATVAPATLAGKKTDASRD
jgi:hypothetical protein